MMQHFFDVIDHPNQQNGSRLCIRLVEVGSPLGGYLVARNDIRTESEIDMEIDAIIADAERLRAKMKRRLRTLRRKPMERK